MIRDVVSSFLKSIPGVAAITQGGSLKFRLWHDIVEDGMLTFCVQVEKQLLETYATEDIVTEGDKGIICFAPPTSMSPLQYIDALWMKTLRCSQVKEK